MLNKLIIMKNFIFFLTISLVTAQDIEHSISIGFQKNNSNNWWQNNNNYGFDSSENFLKYSFNLEGTSFDFLGNIFFDNSMVEKVYIPRMYIGYKTKNSFYIKAGRYYRDFSDYMNDNLSSGSILISHNAQAIPKIGLSYGNIAPFGENISFKLGISHGIFDKNAFYTTPPFLHEKYFYLEVDRQQSQFGIGIVHEAMWAGTTTEGLGYGKQPRGFRNFLKVFISDDGPLLEGEPHPNSLGNHLGIWDIYFVKNFKDKSIKIYHQHIFEDTSSLRFANKFDGLWGIELNNFFWQTNLLVEYIDTTNCCYDPPYQSDNYYWNYQYKSGWRYKENIIGNPHINPENSYFAELTKIIHLGTSGEIFRNINYRFLAFRKINLSDKVKYQFMAQKNVTEKMSFTALFDRYNQDNSFQLGLTYYFNKD